MKRIFVLLIIFSTQMNVFSQEDIVFSNNGYIRFQNQDYHFTIILVNDIQATLEIWKGGQIVNETTRVKISEPISIIIAYATDKDDINLTYNLKLRNSNGESYISESNGLIISNIVRAKRLLFKAENMPTLTLNENTEAGKYHFVIEIYDYNELIKTFILEFDVYK